MLLRLLQILTRPLRWGLGLAKRGMLVTLVIVATAAVVVFLAVEVASRLEALRTAPQDNVQWSLAQLDVELLIVESEVTKAADAAPAGLSKLRQRFDVFYSRVKTTSAMPLFQNNVEAAAVTRQLDTIRAKLDVLVPIIDAPDPQLLAQIGQLRAGIEELRPLTRQVTLNGIKLHASQSDANRTEFSLLLERTAVFNSLLVLALGAALLFLLRQINISKRRADALQISSDRNASTLVTSLDAIIITTMDGRIVEFNDAASRTFGYSRSAAIGAQLDELVIPVRHREEHLRRIARFRTSGQARVPGSERVVLTALKSDGTEFPVEFSLGATNSLEGQLVIAFIRDISQRVEQDAELRKARDEALEASKIKSQFLAVMSHEMRTPLNGVMAILDLLGASKLDAKQMKYVETATASAEILKQHVDDLLDLTRIQAGKFELFPRVFDIIELVEEVQGMNVAVAAKRHNRITLDIDFPQPHFIADRKRIHQVLTNLVGNAIKFTENGRIAISARPVNVNADIVTIEFKVTDSGIGIVKEQQEKIFEDFVTLDSSYQRNAAGAGLGLPICRSIVEAMDGSIGVESALGQGSTFWFRLPLKTAFAKPEAASEQKSQDGRSRRHKHLRVLVIEDNATNRFVAGEMLHASGCDVVLMADGEEGVAAAEKQRFDLILMDLSMPKMNGWDASRRIRASLKSKCRNVPIYALTAHALPEELDALPDAGMQGCMLKPLRSKELNEILNAVSDGQIQQKKRAEPASAADSGPADFVDGHVIGELRDLLGEDLFRQKLEAFAAELKAGLRQIEAVAEKGRLADAVGIAHKLAGSSSVFGAKHLRSCLNALERSAKEDLPKDVRQHLSRVNAAAKEFEAKRQGLLGEV